MEIGDLHQTVAVKLCRQIAESQLDVAHLQLLRLKESAVAESRGGYES